MDGPQLKKQRVRSKNFTTSEVETLKSSIKDHFEVINAKHCNGSSGVTKKMQDNAWLNISQAVNSVGVTKRSVAEIKEKWRNLTKRAKTEVTTQKISAHKTGGGPPAPLMHPVLDDIASLFSGSAAFHGIPGALDSETLVYDLATQDNEINVLATDAQAPYDESTDIQTESIIQIEEGEPSCTSLEVKEPQSSVKTQSMKAKSPQRSLKELQAEYFKIKIENEKRKGELINEQTVLFHRINETFPKINVLIDALAKKLPTGEE